MHQIATTDQNPSYHGNGDGARRAAALPPRPSHHPRRAPVARPRHAALAPLRRRPRRGRRRAVGRGKAELEPRRALTENCSATYANSGNPCLDFFFQVVPDTPPERVRSLLAAAWTHDALTALKLACNLRGVRGTGKSDKEGFYAAALWMHDHHPRTLACNVAALAEFGYLKDFPELLFRLIHGPDARKLARESAAAEKAGRKEKDPGKPRLADRKQARVLAPVPPKPMSGAYLSAALAGSGKGKPMEVEAAPVPVQEPAEQKPKVD